MKIIYKNLKKGELKVKIESLDDLWYLSHVIDPNDLITSRTIRKIKIGKEEDRKTNITKKPVTLTIKVEGIEFHKYSDSLRISGKIIHAPEDVQKGDYHTIGLEENSILLIKKEKWLDFQLKRINEASEALTYKILICTLDREEASFALLKKYGYDDLGELQGNVQKKGDEIKKIEEKEFYSEIIKKLKDYSSRYKVDNIIIASPAFWKEELLKEIEKKSPELKQKITLATCNTTGKNAINEILKRGEVKEILKQDRTAKEVNLVEELFTEISKEGPAAYGLNEVENAANMGAIKTLLVTDELIKKLRLENRYETLDSIIKVVESTRGEIHIISTEHEAGKRLEGLGGIGAILRYKTNY